MCNNYNKLWNISFEIESMLLNITSKDDTAIALAMPLLDSKVKEFNRIYTEIRAANPVLTDEQPSVQASEWIEDTIESAPVEKTPEDESINTENAPESVNLENQISLKEEPADICDTIEEPEVTVDDAAVNTTDNDDITHKSHSEENIIRTHTNLSRYFTLNDRFLFTRELFGGSAEQYAQALSLIESMPDFEVAEDYFINELGWNEEDSNVTLFREIVKRYFKE